MTIGEGERNWIITKLRQYAALIRVSLKIIDAKKVLLQIPDKPSLLPR